MLTPQALPGADAGETALVDVQKVIVAGDPNGSPPDSPGDRVDLNSQASPYAGVGSLEIHFGGQTFICSASVIGTEYVLTAGHCLDLNDNGSIDVNPQDIVFHLNYGGNLTHSIAAEELYIHPNFTGFANPFVNDDIAVIKLSQPVPEGVPIYPLNTDPAALGQQITMVGYGLSGDGVNGYYVDASFEVKRAGGNRTDDFELDDEGNGQVEVFLADFDGQSSSTNCIGGATLGNDVEATLGGGDSGGPSFIGSGAGMELYGINTFTTRFVQFFFFLGPPAPLFGSGFGGITVAPYVDWITSIIGSGSGDARPNVDITSPSDGATVSGTITVAANATDDVGVSQVEFFVEGASIGVDTNGADGWSVSWDTTTASDGNRTVEAVATDSAGQTDADSVLVQVDNVHTPVQLYFSIGTNATIGGVNVARDDIVAWDGASFSLFFDGSDVGLTDPFGTLTIDAFSITSLGEILFSFAEPGGILGFGSFDDSDIVKFTPTSLGENTAGSWSFYFDGSDVGLTQASEDIDALALLPDGRLLVSTTGSVSVPGASGQDEDLLVFTPSSLGTGTSGSWSVYFDGSDVGLGNSSEDVDAGSVGATGEIYLSTLGNFSVPGRSGANEDVFVFRPTQTGPTTRGSYDGQLYFDGSAVGLGSLDLKAIHVPAGSTSAAVRSGNAPNRLGGSDRLPGAGVLVLGATLSRESADVSSAIADGSGEENVVSQVARPAGRSLSVGLQSPDTRRAEHVSQHEPADRLFSELDQTGDGSTLLDPIMPFDVHNLLADLLTRS
jgi:hypothetical protein